MTPLEQALDGTLPPNVALARLLLGGTAPAEIRAWINAGAGRGRFLPLLEQAEAAVLPLRDLLAAGEPDDLAGQRALFDRAVALSPEAAVAAWSLGDPACLAAATDEIVNWLGPPPAGTALDLGCGTGRLSAALARRGMATLGVDLSPAMIAIAQARHPGLAFAVTQGDGLAWLAPRRFDLILAVDVFPYLHRAGLAARHVSEAAALLEEGGRLVILNLSYRDDQAADRRDAEAWARQAGLHLRLAGARPFSSWDGQAFLLERPLAGSPPPAQPGR